jgi:PAS domain S-box-containing protein
VYQTFNEVYRTGIAAKAFDWELIRKDGTRRNLEISVSLARDSKGQPIGFYGIGRDVTERKQAEEALQASEEKYRTILNSIEEGYYEVDLAGNFTFFNESLAKNLGYSKEELLGMNNRRYMNGETSKLVFETFNEVYRTGKPKTAFEWELIGKDGTKRFVECSVSLMRNERGEPKGFYGTARDITERKKEEEALKEREKKYRMTLQNLDVEYFEVDLAGNFTFFTDIFCRILGYSEEELMGMNNRRYQSEETAKKVYQVYNEVYRTGKPSKLYDWEVICKDGTKRVVETSQCLMQDSRGQPIGFCGIARDVTERKQAEEQLRQHEQQMMQMNKMVALGTLVSGVAHEINNPNNFIMLNTPLLSEIWESSKPILEEYYEKNGDFLIGGMPYREMRENIPVLFSGILDGSKRIKQIVEDLRDFVRRDGSDMTQSFDVNGVIRSAISLLSNIIMKATTHFSVKYGDSLPPLKGNFQRFEQVIINLIQNACQALPGAQRGIFLSTSYDEEREGIVIRIKDEGMGIPADVLPHIAEPFFTTKQDFGGLGLGLSISSRIVKEHGGTLNFTSEQGKGTTAEIVLPVPKTRKVLTGRMKT